MSYLISLFEAAISCKSCHHSKNKLRKLHYQHITLGKIKEAFYDGDESAVGTDSKDKNDTSPAVVQEEDGGVLAFTCEELACKCFECSMELPLVHEEIEKYRKEMAELEKKTLKEADYLKKVFGSMKDK